MCSQTLGVMPQQRHSIRGDCESEKRSLENVKRRVDEIQTKGQANGTHPNHNAQPLTGGCGIALCDGVIIRISEMIPDERAYALGSEQHIYKKAS